MVMGQYDAVIVGEAPDDTTYTKALLTLASAATFDRNAARLYRGRIPVDCFQPSLIDPMGAPSAEHGALTLLTKTDLPGQSLEVLYHRDHVVFEFDLA